MLHNLKGTLHLQTFLFTYTVSSSYLLFATVDCFHFVEAMLYSNEKHCYLVHHYLHIQVFSAAPE